MMKPKMTIIAVVCLAGCSDPCTTLEVDRATSPNGLLDVVLMERDCGATTGFSTQISILSQGDRRAGKGNVFIADTDHGLALAGEWGGPWADIHWLSDEKLSVSYAKNSRIFKMEKKVSGVSVGYEIGFPAGAER